MTHRRKIKLFLVCLALLVLLCVRWNAPFDKLWVRNFLQGPNREVVYNEELLNKAYWNSTQAAYRDVFVGDMPLFPPCTPTVPPGIPNWGKHPFVGPFNFINTSKNPCWQEVGGTLRCVPYFYLVGVTKAGTTDLFARISKHPDVIKTVKEVCYFQKKRFSFDSEEKGFLWYTEHFKPLADEVRSDIKTFGYSTKIVGDGTPGYFRLSRGVSWKEYHGWEEMSGNEGCAEPRVIVANQLRHIFPGVKIFVSLREPASRLYSEFLFFHRNRGSIQYQSPQTFHDGVVEGIKAFRNCLRHNGLRSCVYNMTVQFQMNKMKMFENMYSVYMEDWLRAIPRDQIYVNHFEDYASDVKGHLRQIYQFLELEPISDQDLQKIADDRIHNKNGKYETVGPMLPQTRQLLEDFFRPFNERLADLLGDRRFLWLKEEHS